jgi:hypothetical protein
MSQIKSNNRDQLHTLQAAAALNAAIGTHRISHYMPHHTFLLVAPAAAAHRAYKASAAGVIAVAHFHAALKLVRGRAVRLLLFACYFVVMFLHVFYTAGVVAVHTYTRR